MKTAIDYLNDLKEKLGSDYKIAKAFGVDTAAISMIRKRGKVSDETAIKIAELLEIDPAEILIAAAVARSEGEVKGAWERISKQIGRAALIILALNIFSYKSEAYANGINNIELDNLYIMRSLKSAILRLLARLNFFSRRNSHATRKEEKIDVLSCALEHGRTERRTSRRNTGRVDRRNSAVRPGRRAGDGGTAFIALG